MPIEYSILLLTDPRVRHGKVNQKTVVSQEADSATMKGLKRVDFVDFKRAMVYITFFMIAANIARLQDRILRRCNGIGRDAGDVTLVAVSKTFPAEKVREAVHAGVIDIGENYVQEMQAKKDLLTDEPIRWHFVGHLQKNKVRALAPWVHLIHAVDSASLAREIDRRAAQAGRVIEVLIEVNTTGEESKFGVDPGKVVDLVDSMNEFQNIRIAGLMTIGPFHPDANAARPMFRKLRQLKEELTRVEQDNLALRHLSMGMTGDFEVALEEGATLLRIGTAIFGTRNAPAQATNA